MTMSSASSAQSLTTDANTETDGDDLWSFLPMPSVLLNKDARVLRLNPAAEAFLNTSTNSARNIALSQLIRTKDPIEASIRRAFDTTGALNLNAVGVLTQDGDVACNIRIARMGESGSVLMLIEPRDIGGKLDRTEQAKAATRSVVGLAELLSHEIKNPIAGITGAAQLLSMSLGAEDRNLTHLIVEECQRIVSLLNQVEQFGDLRPPDLRPVNLHDVLEQARTSAALGFAAHMDFHLNYDPSLPTANADRGQLLQIFQNLIRNASEAAGNSGRITLRTFFDIGLSVISEDGSRRALPLHIEVQDDGPGLPDDIRDQIFEPFVTAKQNGTGLGLALVSKLVVAHGGIIHVESTAGKTIFRISLPIAQSD
jgi:two-component system nitrogen regulation sensor histidine kinase GlnL